MRFNTIGLSAILAMTASALPVAGPVETVWETVYETVYATVAPVSAPTNLPIVEAAVIPSTFSTWAPAVPTTTSIPTLSTVVPTVIPTVVPTTTSAVPPSTSSAAATGSGVSIVNNLSHPVYLWVVTDNPGVMQTLAAGETFTDSWLINNNGGGISIKMSTTEVCDDVLQFEYTQSGSVLFWDLSSIDMAKDSPFVTAGFGVTISDESCPTATCAPGDAYCVESYQLPDDVNTLACGLDNAYTLTLG
ncbi:uncharacterized protein N7479_005429 [Penicillium vulpinum]|uniref:Antigenic thaumatin-like protein n=1 Tax=Penicillium vulpinum TaxID=29845 RepID=A0A1V6SE72_9EURO|nr:uncharacterized protein N7479_005429 [Penicillium vulpinum]KAJ5958279.1 hypothetical protein N7479_005429 [Penicillium vulpinum]OQE12291.1 hypothetical protein PENVUL_c001G00797 [Penicillium vulpinum]